MIRAEPFSQIGADRDLVGRDVLAVVGALDEPPQFTPSVADGVP
jgi:hypothetical protein